MCGISGIFSFSSEQSVDGELLKSMNRAQSHRGPDDEGYYLAPGVALGHRRLSIIDLSGGHQPIFNEDGSVAIVFNGEIYNHKAVKSELETLGHTFASHSDTETIVHAWEEWGVDCLVHLNGMFAFAVWDNNQKVLFVARDRAGEKPIYYSHLDDGSVIFGSELKVLKQHPLLDKTLNERSIEDFLTFGYIPEPKSIYQSVHKLKAGHYFLLTQDESTKVVPIEYWDLPWQAIEQSTDETLPEAVYQKLKSAVDLRMESEVPLGAFLSGGVDSSAVVAMMSQLQDNPVTTCAIGFDIPEFNESDFAQMVADHCKTDHHLDVVSVDDFELIDKLSSIYDEPFADNSALPTYMVCRSARKHVTVALSGDAGDELFVGYRRYRMHLNEHRVREKVPAFIRNSVIKPLAKIYPKLDWAPRFLRAKTTLESISMSPANAYLNSVSILRHSDRFSLYSESFKRRLDGYTSKSVFDEQLEGKSFSCPVKMAQYIDFKTWMPSDILTKVDRASMANSLEVRVPMLDHNFIEWAFTLPLSDNLKGQNGKSCLKKAMEPHLPYDNLYRDKMGFSSPVANWLRGPLKSKLRKALDNLIGSKLKLFNETALNRLFNEHQSERHDHGTALWSLLMLSAFIES
ncbi:MAG: asparagine synthetase B [Candidatus Marinimicrobia bacterium]|nr:asparagine synthetase B [Candidatus Neomarinimicrobiota bacterium]|tara:strand:+ start:2865 stop:4751 length:1887 start_codon:yes stop_codon:yes gene_type:complete